MLIRSKKIVEKDDETIDKDKNSNNNKKYSRLKMSHLKHPDAFFLKVFALNSMTFR